MVTTRTLLLTFIAISSLRSFSIAALPDYENSLAGQWICTRYCPAGGEGRLASIKQDNRVFQG
jgi:hypothetical protein